MDLALKVTVKLGHERFETRMSKLFEDRLVTVSQGGDCNRFGVRMDESLMVIRTGVVVSKRCENHEPRKVTVGGAKGAKSNILLRSINIHSLQGRSAGHIEGILLHELPLGEAHARKIARPD